MLSLEPILPMLAVVEGGGYINPFKVAAALLALLVWGRLLTWADEDAQAAHLPRDLLNSVNLGGLIIAFAAFFIVPTFIVAFLAVVILFAAEVGVYLVLRNKEVGLEDLKKELQNLLKGVKGDKKNKKDKSEVGRLIVLGPDGKALPIPEDDSPDRPAFDALQTALTGPIVVGAQQVDIVPEGDGIAIKYIVDNFTHRGPVVDRAVGVAMIVYAKWAAGVSIEEKRKPQTGLIKVMLEREKHELRVQSAGTTAGEYLRITVDPKVRHTYRLPELGFSPAQLQLLQELIKTKDGLVILSAPKTHGLTSLFYSILRSHDAFLEHAQTLEREQEQDLEGITQTKLDPNASGEEERKQLDWVISQQPDVVGVDRLEDAKAARGLIEYAASGKRAYVCVRANSTFEALEQWKRLVGDAALSVKAVRAVVNGRVLRKLCMACKEGFAPDPVMLKKLNFSADKVTTLYKARETPLKDGRGNPIACEFCHELRYKGRLGVYETLVVDEDIRTAVSTNKPPNHAFRKQRGRYLQEEALSLVESGDTSVQEVLRVMKPAVEGAAAAAKAPARPATSAARPAVKNR